jgi:hypothetical protein
VKAPEVGGLFSHRDEISTQDVLFGTDYAQLI